MMNALQTLKDNGCSDSAIKAVLADLIENDEFEDDDDRRCCIALAWYNENEGSCDPDDCAIERDDTVCIAGNEYRVLSDDEADAACHECIEDSVWSFIPGFLAEKTGIDSEVFAALQDKCENGNPAVLSIINGSCGINDFVESAVNEDGRGHFLAYFDNEERECGDYYLYRVN
jgi:hypothetical protein